MSVDKVAQELTSFFLHKRTKMMLNHWRVLTPQTQAVNEEDKASSLTVGEEPIPPLYGGEMEEPAAGEEDAAEGSGIMKEDETTVS